MQHLSKKILFVLACVFVTLSMSACSSIKQLLGMDGADRVVAANDATSALSDNVAMFDIVMNDNFYGYSDSNMTSPPTWTVPSGADIVINLENRGNLKHNWGIVQQGLNVPVPFDEEQGSELLLFGAGMVYGNSQSTVTLAAPAPGTYQIICTVSGHYPFMQGRLIVTQANR